eukprot:jgi/Botrbrau1/21551/Bobra.174_2s0052.1
MSRNFFRITILLLFGSFYSCRADCVRQAMRLQRGACSYRSQDTSNGDDILNMDCASLVAAATNPWNPPTEACCRDLIDFTWNGCGCDGTLDKCSKQYRQFPAPF